jgi:hypothetical protein
MLTVVPARRSSSLFEPVGEIADNRVDLSLLQWAKRDVVGWIFLIYAGDTADGAQRGWPDLQPKVGQHPWKRLLGTRKQVIVLDKQQPFCW